MGLFWCAQKSKKHENRGAIPKFYWLFLFVPNKKEHRPLLKSSFATLPFILDLLLNIFLHRIQNKRVKDNTIKLVTTQYNS